MQNKNHNLSFSPIMKSYFLVLILSFFALPSLAQDLELNQKDASGKKQGKWIVPYKDSDYIRYEGQFKDDKPVGLFKYYGPDAMIQKEVSYTGNKAAAKFYRDNKLISEGNYLNQKREGIWKFYKGGDLVRQENYKNDLLEGKSTSYYRQGNPAVIEFYKEGMKDSVSVSFSKRGKIIEECTYLEGMKHGTEILYTAEGKKELEIHYEYDEPVGTGEAYNTDGSVHYLMHYADGKIQEIEYRNGQAIDYYEVDIPERVRNFKNGKLHGQYLEYHSNYRYELQDYVQELTNRREKKRVLIHHKKVEGNYKMGQKHGVFKYFDENGELINTEEYSLGKLLK